MPLPPDLLNWPINLPLAGHRQFFITAFVEVMGFFTVFFGVFAGVFLGALEDGLTILRGLEILTWGFGLNFLRRHYLPER